MITEQQARAIAFLARDMRPHGARRWDERGTYAAVMKVRDRKLSDVVLAVARAADDRDANTPNVLLTPRSPHWRERDTGWVPPSEPFDAVTTCGICGLTETRCKTNPNGGHEFVSHLDSKRARRPKEEL